MYREKKPGKLVSFPVNPDYLKDLQEGRVFRHDLAKSRALELVSKHPSFAGFSAPEHEMFAEKIARCTGLRANDVRTRSLDTIVREETEREAADLWGKVSLMGNGVTINEIFAVLGKSVLDNYDIRKSWAISAKAGKTREEVLDDLKNGRFRIEETPRAVILHIDS